MERNVNDIIQEIKEIDNNVTNVIVPILKDTIEDYRKVVFRLIIVIILLILSLFGISAYSIYKYNAFLSQFEFESEDTVFQDLQSSDDSALTVNSGIDINK